MRLVNSKLKQRNDLFAGAKVQCHPGVKDGSLRRSTTANTLLPKTRGRGANQIHTSHESAWTFDRAQHGKKAQG